MFRELSADEVDELFAVLVAVNWSVGEQVRLVTRSAVFTPTYSP